MEDYTKIWKYGNLQLSRHFVLQNSDSVKLFKSCIIKNFLSNLNTFEFFVKKFPKCTLFF